MAKTLYRIGRWAFRRRRLVAGLWLSALVLAGVAAAVAPAGQEEDLSMPGTESQKAFDLLTVETGGSALDSEEEPGGTTHADHDARRGGHHGSAAPR